MGDFRLGGEGTGVRMIPVLARSDPLKLGACEMLLGKSVLWMLLVSMTTRSMLWVAQVPALPYFLVVNRLYVLWSVDATSSL